MMPYIAQERRKEYDENIKKVAKLIAKLNIDDCTTFCGDWNYCITKLIKETLKEENCKKNYSQQNEVIGMLESCKLEWYRKELAPYEDEKIKINGEV